MKAQIKPGVKGDIGARLAKAQGQLRGLCAMIEDERDPAEILTLVSAIKAALDGVGAMVLTGQIESAMAGGGELSRDEVAERIQSVRLALKRYTG